MIEFRLDRSSTRPGRPVIEVFHNGRFVATVTPDDECGVRVLSKYAMTVSRDPAAMSLRQVIPNAPDAVTVKIDPTTMAEHLRGTPT